MTEIRIGIFGSCVTRDIWTLLKIPDSGLKLFARTSIPSMVAPSANFSLPMALGNIPPGGFDDRCIRADILKEAIPEMEQFDPAYLFFDFVDERFDLMKINHSVISAGWLYVRSNLSATAPFSNGQIVPRLSEDALKLWRESLVSLRARIDKSTLKKAKIILHECYWARSELNSEGNIVPLPKTVGLYAGQNAKISDHNAMLRLYHSEFLAVFPESIVIKVPERLRISDPHHIWGPAPFHFIPAYYQEAWEQISTHLPAALEKKVKQNTLAPYFPKGSKSTSETTQYSKTHIICMTPRVGSTAIVSALESGGLTQGPILEIFNSRAVIPKFSCEYKSLTLLDYINHHFDGNKAKRLTFKTTWWDLDEVLRFADFEDIFPKPKFVYLERGDRIAQAYSFWKATKFGVWHRPKESAYISPVHTAPVVEIKSIMSRIEKECAQWEYFFSARNIKPLRIRYEDFLDSTQAVTSNIFRFLTGATMTKNAESYFIRSTDHTDEAIIQELNRSINI